MSRPPHQHADEPRSRGWNAQPEPPAGPEPRRPYVPMLPERPGTVTAAAVILFVSAGIGILGCAILVVILLAGQADLASDEQTVLTILSGLLLVSSVLNVVLGCFILRGHQWARVTVFVLCAIGIFGSVISLGATGDSAGLPTTCTGVVINAVIIGLLNRPAAGDYFRARRT